METDRDFYFPPLPREMKVIYAAAVFRIPLCNRETSDALNLPITR